MMTTLAITRVRSTGQSAGFPSRRSLSRLCGALVLCAVVTEVPKALAASSIDRSTTPVILPNNITLANLDDDPAADLVQFVGNRLLASRTDFAGSALLHHYFRANVQRLIIGDFTRAGREHGRDQICAVLANSSMECYAPSDDRKELWWWFTQPSPVTSTEQALVGDFDGDGADDILAYKPSNGAIRILSRQSTGFFAPLPETAFTLGNLATLNRVNKKLYVGEFGQAAGRDDLLVLNPTTGSVAVYATATDTAGRTTFWWGFTTVAGAVASNEQVTVANIEGGTRDGLILRKSGTGAYRFRRVVYDSGNLQPVPASAVLQGQLPVTAHPGVLAAAKLKHRPTEPGVARNDTLFFDSTARTMILTSARYDGARYTYWWAYTKPTPVQTGWAARRDEPLAIILCKLADVSFTPDANEMKRNLLGRGNGSLRDYLFEVTYGIKEIANADVFGWVTTSLRAADSNSRRPPNGVTTPQYIAGCKSAARIPSGRYQAVLVVLNDTNVSFQGYPGGATFDYLRVIDRRFSAIAHESLHALGLRHAHADGGPDPEYGDVWDVMGNFYSTWIEDADGGAIGPELNAAHRSLLGAMPSGRVRTLTPSLAHNVSTTVKLAAVERPEANGPLMVKIPVNSSTYYTVEYRERSGYDANLPADAVQVHKVTGPDTYLQTSPSDHLLAGDVYINATLSVRVNAVDPATGIATVTITH